MDAQIVRQAVRLRHLEQIAEPRPTGDQRNSLVAMVYDHPFPWPLENGQELPGSYKPISR